MFTIGLIRCIHKFNDNGFHISYHLHSPLNDMLKPFGISKEDLANFLKDEAVIGGSFAIASFQKDPLSEVVGDMDIYKKIPVQIYTSNTMIIRYFEEDKKWFSNYGYSEIINSYYFEKNKSQKAKYIQKYKSGKLIFEVKSFQNKSNKKKIDVIYIKKDFTEIGNYMDFTICNTFITFQNTAIFGKKYQEYFVSRHLNDVKSKRLVPIMSEVEDFSFSNRKSRLDKYLARGFTIDDNEKNKYLDMIKNYTKN